MQIRTKLYIVILLSILLGISATAILNYSIFSTEIVHTLNVRENLNLREIKNDVDQNISAVHQTLETLRSSSEVRIILSLLRRGESNRDLSLHIRRSLKATQSMLPLAVDINIADSDGHIIMSSSGGSGNISSADIFKKAMNGYKASALTYDDNDKFPRKYSIAAPVVVGSETLGAVVIDLNAADLFKYDTREKYENDDSDALYLIDETGRVIVRMGRDFGESRGIAPGEILSRTTKEQQGHIVVSDGVLFFSSLSEVKWHLAAYSPKSSLYMPVIRFRNISAAVYIAIIALALVGAKLLTTQIIPRLKRGVTYAEAVAGGDISGILDDESPDELGRLFRAIDTMVNHLRSALTEAKVQEQKATEIGEALALQNSQLETIVGKRTIELEEAQKHSSLLLDLTTEAIFELDIDGNIKAANSTAIQMLGYDPDELLGHEFFSVTQHNFQEGEPCYSPACEFRRATVSGKKRTLDGIWMTTKGGNNIPVNITVSPVIKRGERIGTVIAIIDITDLIRTGRMMQALYNTADEGYLFFSGNFELINCNKALVKLFKAQSEQHIVENFMLFSPPCQPSGKRSSDAFAEHSAVARKCGEARFEWRHQDIHGSDIPCYVTMTRINADNEYMFIAAIRDLSDQKKAEAALTEQREQLQEILDSSPTTMAIILDGLIRKVNDKGIEMFNLKPGDTSKKLYVDIEQHKKALSAIGLGAQVKNWEVRMNGADGEILDTLMSLHPFVYEGKPALLTWISDVTELTRAKIMAEEAAKAKSDFLASMSHEIRTPMNAILGMTHLCIQTKPDAKQMNYLVKIQKAANVLLTIINDILDFSKIESGKFTLENTPFKLSEVLKGLWDLVAFRAEEKGVKFSMSIDGEIPKVMMGDPLRINQVLVNLCNNSIKFTERGNISLLIASRVEEESIDGMPIAELRFSVTDTGIGMTEEQVGRLFKPFTQADGSITRKYGGSGLGLSISKSLVENMGGRIWVESVFGEGSTFSFIIKLAVVDDYDETGLPVKSLTRGESHDKEHKKIDARVLLVEDNEINQEIAVEMLQQFGAKVDVAPDGQEALDMLERSRNYDLVFMDVQMPIMDGLEATRRIRLLMGITKDELPIIAMTAHAMKGDYEKSIDAGMNDHITKPIDPDELYETLKLWAITNRK